MKKMIYIIIALFGLTLIATTLYFSFSQRTIPLLKEGDKAPEFTLLATSADQKKEIRLSDYLGQKVILYFYPMDNSPFCKKQAKSLQEKHKVLRDMGYVVLGVSRDSISSHQAFIKKHNLSFLLISDTTGILHEKYGAWKNLFFFWRHTNRMTFIINEKGYIEEIIDKVAYSTHADQIISHHKS